MDYFLLIASTLFFIYFYFIMTQYFEFKRFYYLQETTVAMLIGLFVGIFLYFFSDAYQQLNNSALRNIIFLVLLPPIMFQDGYNFPRRKFFQNIFYITLYGFFGTVFNFFIIYGILYLFNQKGLIFSISDSGQSIKLFNWQMLVISGCLCSQEPIVTQKVVTKEKHPKLFSIIFGESLFKDTISVTLVNSIVLIVTKSNSSTVDINSSDVGQIVGKFFLTIFASIFIGVATGIVTTLLFKNFRFLVEQKGLCQVSMTIISGYFCYIISQWQQFSGVISMVYCCIIMSHFNSYNMTHQGKKMASVTVQIFKIMASGVIFFMIGFYLFNIQTFQSEVDNQEKSTLSITLIGITFLAMVLGRLGNMLLMTTFGYFFIGKEKWRLNRYEYVILYLSGLVKGAVPFALVTTIPFISSLPSSQAVQSDIVVMVFLTSLVFNTLNPKLQKILLNKIKIMKLEEPHHPSLRDSLIVNDYFTHGMSKEKQQEIVLQRKNSKQFLKGVRGCFQKYWKRIEQGGLKPCLIYNYIGRRNQIKQQKMKQRKKEYILFMKKHRKDEDYQGNILSQNQNYDNDFIQIISDDDSSSSGNQHPSVQKIKRGSLARQSNKRENQKSKSQIEIPQVSSKEEEQKNNTSELQFEINIQEKNE